MAKYDDILEHLFVHMRPLAKPGVELDEATDLVRTLGLDSTTLVDIILDVEDEFDVSVPLNALSDVQTAGELATLIHGLTEEQ